MHLLPYADEIWSSNGLLPDPSLNLTYGVFPNILYILSGPFAVTFFVGILFILAVLFLIGFQRPIISILLWYGWVCLFDRNNLISNPGIPYIGWILLCCAAVPKGEPLSLSKTKEGIKWQFPIILFIGAWTLMACGYTISGIDKFFSPSWRDGSAILHLVENPLARDWWPREVVMAFPDSLIKFNSWAVLSLEILFLPLVLINFTRKWVWLAMISMHLGILMIVDFADLTIGMLMIHWFTFDARWLKAKPKQTGIIFFDGVCGICNGFVDFMMSEDKNNTLVYAPLQGITAKEKLNKKYLIDINTIAYQEGDQTYTQSDAVLKSLASIGGIWKLFLVFKVVPKFIHNSIYNFVSTNRFSWFGKRETCRLPTPEEKNKILL